MGVRHSCRTLFVICKTTAITRLAAFTNRAARFRFNFPSLFPLFCDSFRRIAIYQSICDAAAIYSRTRLMYGNMELRPVLPEILAKTYSRTAGSNGGLSFM
jgi:hypothetical protein